VSKKKQDYFLLLAKGDYKINLTTTGRWMTLALIVIAFMHGQPILEGIMS